MRWATVTEANDLIPLPAGYAFEQLSRSQIPELAAKVQQWHPDIVIGAGSCYIREQFYLDKAFLANEAERDVFVLLIKFAGEIVGMWSYEREPDALSIYGRLLIVAPEHRGSKVALGCMSGTKRICRTCGAEFVYTMATLKVPHMQVALERAGYQLVGFAPGYDREVGRDGAVKRIFEAVYGKVLVPEGDMLRPDPDNLTPRTKALFELMFPTSTQ
ncbi:MAG: GNAT family N-acetyltransferase [Polaromonas sp.]|uniref:GNAT family N-acetyltransferase n=1 Tax=Polaromonas sp. TaxID=1869339 RepID=UPI002733AC72|nr:GNAT family N-acetyltransferase [Polaromonas sp.]MDP2816838.1 GNAT family N-acetyltransferase [Polaromonas sp.]